jgi:hypothetical protein
VKYCLNRVKEVVSGLGREIGMEFIEEWDFAVGAGGAVVVAVALWFLPCGRAQRTEVGG